MISLTVKLDALKRGSMKAVVAMLVCRFKKNGYLRKKSFCALAVFTK